MGMKNYWEHFGEHNENNKNPTPPLPPQKKKKPMPPSCMLFHLIGCKNHFDYFLFLPFLAKMKYMDGFIIN
jgi:hypothetical protein